MWTRAIATALVFSAIVVSAALCAEGTAAAQGAGGPAVTAQTREVLVEFTFDDGKGLTGPFRGTWHSNEAAEARLSLDAPLGTGNASTKAMTCHTKKALPYVSCEVALHGTVVEPQGWDGEVSFKFYNGGFESFYMTYLPLIPSDVTFHRARFTAPKGQWVEMKLPVDKFLYRGCRPRRGCPLEYLVFVAEGAEGDDSVFQFDDFRLSRVKQANPRAAKPKPPLGEGVIYQQNFDDVGDFDLEGYYPWTPNCTALRVPGGLDAAGKPMDTVKETEAGCLKVEGFKKADEVRGGRRIDFPGEGTLLEFDCLIQGAADFGVVVRNVPDHKKFRQYAHPQPESGKWTHCVMSGEDFAPYGTPSKAGGTEKHGKAEKFFEVLFHAFANDTNEPHYILIDNLVVRRAPGPITEKK